MKKNVTAHRTKAWRLDESLGSLLIILVSEFNIYLNKYIALHFNN